MIKILVADREEAFCLMYQDELTEEGYEVVSVTRPEAFLKAVEKENPDLVLMDSEMDDPDVQRFLKGVMTSGYRVPGILCTTYSDSKEFCRSFADDIVMKSASLDELKGKVRGILENRGELISPDISRVPVSDEAFLSARRGV
ncbi:MAG: response regulator [Deltaproteobacteria bacterium]|nr:response regulator [Deltaproteobacteria bacterium]